MNVAPHPLQHLPVPPRVFTRWSGEGRWHPSTAQFRTRIAELLPNEPKAKPLAHALLRAERHIDAKLFRRNVKQLVNTTLRGCVRGAPYAFVCAENREAQGMRSERFIYSAARYFCLKKAFVHCDIARLTEPRTAYHASKCGTILLLDDCAYSGINLASNIEATLQALQVDPSRIHVGLIGASTAAFDRINTLIPSSNIHARHRIPMLHEEVPELLHAALSQLLQQTHVDAHIEAQWHSMTHMWYKLPENHPAFQYSHRPSTFPYPTATPPAQVPNYEELLKELGMA